MFVISERQVDDLVDGDRSKCQLNEVDDIKHDGRLHVDVAAELSDGFRQDAQQHQLTASVVQQATLN